AGVIGVAKNAGGGASQEIYPPGSELEVTWQCGLELVALPLDVDSESVWAVDSERTGLDAYAWRGPLTGASVEIGICVGAVLSGGRVGAPEERRKYEAAGPKMLDFLGLHVMPFAVSRYSNRRPHSAFLSKNGRIEWQNRAAKIYRYRLIGRTPSCF